MPKHKTCDQRDTTSTYNDRDNAIEINRVVTLFKSELRKALVKGTDIAAFHVTVGLSGENGRITGRHVGNQFAESVRGLNNEPLV